MNYSVFLNRARVYSTIKDFEKAMDDAYECIRLKPNWQDGYHVLGQIYLAASKPNYKGEIMTSEENSIYLAFTTYRNGI